MNVSRVIKYKKYRYLTKSGRILSNQRQIDYLNTLKIPQTYTNVLMTTNKRAKVVGTGRDKTGKRQYFYNKTWVAQTSRKKYCAMIIFGKALPHIMRVVKTNLRTASKKSKVYYISIIVKIIMLCNFRIGNHNNTNDGITDISLKNVIIRRSLVKISFIGKKGQINECDIVDPYLKRIVRHLYKNNHDPKHFFSFRDDCGKIIRITHIDVNNFLKTFGPFTAKMFRTWNANILYLDYIRSHSIKDDLSKVSKAAISHACEHLHNTEAICKKNYLIPELIEDIGDNSPNIHLLLKSLKRHSIKTESILIKYLIKNYHTESKEG